MKKIIACLLVVSCAGGPGRVSNKDHHNPTTGTSEDPVTFINPIDAPSPDPYGTLDGVSSDCDGGSYWFDGGSTETDAGGGNLECCTVNCNYEICNTNCKLVHTEHCK